jgi:hypothetical protein
MQDDDDDGDDDGAGMVDRSAALPVAGDGEARTRGGEGG